MRRSWASTHTHYRTRRCAGACVQSPRERPVTTLRRRVTGAIGRLLPARAEIAIRRVKWWQAVTEHNHAHLQTNGGNLATAPRRATNVDIRRCLSAHSKSFRSSRNTSSSRDPTPNSCTAARKTLVTGKRTTNEFLTHTLELLVDWYLHLGYMRNVPEGRGENVDGLASSNL